MKERDGRGVREVLGELEINKRKRREDIRRRED
jgi:hypothetical protein